MSESTLQQTTAEQPISPSSALLEALDLQRHNLLDIRKRNPLTNAPIRTFRRNQLLIAHELSDEIYRILYVEGKKFTFLPAKGIDADARSVEEAMNLSGDLFVPDELVGEVHLAHTDTKLQTLLTPAALQKKLLYIYREAKSIEEEQGISVLFLALGFLCYFESESSEVERCAPLILLPVELTRDSRKGVFRLAKRDMDLESNKSLAMLLHEDFQLTLPDFPDNDSWRPTEYFNEVREAVASKPRWNIEPDSMALSFFSFAKFLMYRDLELENYQSDDVDITGVRLIEDLLTGGHSSAEDSPKVSITAPEQIPNLDAKFSNPKELGHILDADSSQTQVISSAMDGKNIVVQGPPGTGKSQTIANLIAGAVNCGKRVLFIAEKRAALEVVMKRLVQCGLGPLCLELHSHKANKAQVYGSLRETWELNRPVDVAETEYDELRQLRDRLNRVSDLVHTQDSTTGNTAFRLMGKISRLSGKRTPPADFDISEIDSWSIQEFDERCSLVARFAEATTKHGPEHQHIWRGVENRLSPIDRQRMENLIDQASTTFDELSDRFEQGRTAASVSWNLTEYRVHQLVEQLVQIQSMPTNAPELLRQEVVVDHCEAAIELCELLEQVRIAETALEGTVISQAFESKWELHLNAVAKEGTSIFRLFKSSYLNAISDLKEVCTAKLPGKQQERFELLEKLVHVEKLRTKIDNREVLGRECFGIQWQQSKTSYESVYGALSWIGQQAKSLGDIGSVQEQVANLNESVDFENVKIQLLDVWNTWSALWKQVTELTGLDNTKAFGSQDLSSVEIEEISQRLSAWAEHPTELAGYHELLSIGDLLKDKGLVEIRNQIGTGHLACSTAVDTFSLLRSERVLKNILNEHPELESLSGSDRTAMVEKFKEKDEELRLLTAREVSLKHYESIPRGSTGMVGVVRGELAKKRRHMPIRKLLDTAGDVVAALKPVFLMSPMSVAQYLKPGGLQFDLLLIDEASQVKPQEALGAMLRAKQVVVVGDQKQMPPTSFFDRQMSGDDESGTDESETEIELDTSAQMAQQSTDMESILALCDARFGNRAMLSWHYRSEHPSLIDVSNHEFYSGKLLYPPSAEFAGTINGMKFVHVTDGVYDRSRRRHNEVEADTICEHILAHVRDHPNWTLGVVGLSVAQRNLMQTKVEALCREHPHVERFCDESNEEPFFVKNLENVQGDERDVIFVSIGYGKDANGYFGQSFGPVSQKGGERRLNVLFTRARKRCVIFASITPDDIRVDAAQHQGPRVLKRFMKYAATGDLDIPVETGDEMDSPFEEDVASVLEEHGYVVHPQVGASGFKIDLAIVDPDNDNHYVLAIECDGARYHSSSWARERDRLRQQVLERKGWRFHRIWSTDWFYSRAAEIQKLVRAVEEARQFFKSQHASDSNFATSAGKGKVESSSNNDRLDEEDPNTSLSEGDSSRASRSPSERLVERSEESHQTLQSSPYRELIIDVDDELLTNEIHELEPSFFVEITVKMVDAEGPVHSDAIAARIARSWGKSRVGSRIRSTIQQSIELALEHGQILRSDSDGEEFFVSKDYSESNEIRDRSSVQLSKLKFPDVIPRSEIRAAVRVAVDDNVSLTIEECRKEVQRMLGTNLGRDKMDEIISSEVLTLAEKGSIRLSGEMLSKVS
ncbi:MAG: DUF3320 domain-containing protein [Gammaproteobacteria bacterium]|nr:DUF3320 domain-containing protein [Gammaproteobacteria bacterium]MYD81281.1 DUF3320 domain-containing protein [Gammaproteobacteria bacterium]